MNKKWLIVIGLLAVSALFWVVIKIMLPAPKNLKEWENPLQHKIDSVINPQNIPIDPEAKG